MVACLLIASALVTACSSEQNPAPPAWKVPVHTHDPYSAKREAMVRKQLLSREIRDEAVLRAMNKVPRHHFVPAAQQALAYEDFPLPIGEDQTISQPYIVAYMAEMLALDSNDKVLEIGTGSGYHAAVLAEIAREVYTIEIVPSLARRSAKTLKDLGYANVHVREGDGYLGWPEQAPFDAILVTAAPDHIPQPLIDQLGVEGTMVIPVGDLFQEIVIVTRTKRGVVQRRTIPVRFVPMTGKAQD